MKISKTKAIELINNSGGKFITVIFTKRNGEKRTMNCRKIAGNAITSLGYLKVVETKTKTIKNVNTRRLLGLKMNKQQYNIG